MERFENSLLKVNEQWLDKLIPLHPAFIALRIKMIPRSARKHNADAAMATINLDLVATTLLRIISKLRDPRVMLQHIVCRVVSLLNVLSYGSHLLRLMKKYHAKPGQHGSFLGATKSLHLAIGIRPPSEGAIRKCAMT